MNSKRFGEPENEFRRQLFDLSSPALLPIAPLVPTCACFPNATSSVVREFIPHGITGNTIRGCHILHRPEISQPDFSSYSELAPIAGCRRTMLRLPANVRGCHVFPPYDCQWPFHAFSDRRPLVCGLRHHFPNEKRDLCGCNNSHSLPCSTGQRRPTVHVHRLRPPTCFLGGGGGRAGPSVGVVGVLNPPSPLRPWLRSRPKPSHPRVPEASKVGGRWNLIIHDE
jgi:hypothetical protein